MPHPRLRFGVRGQDSYENNWCVTLNNAWNNCDGFGTQLQSTDDWAYYYNLHGAKPLIEATWDFWGDAQGGADVVDLFFLDTHGGNWGANAVFAMWDNWVTANSTAMRLGDNQLSVFATYACDVLDVGDGNQWNRWYNAFAGGLRIATGGHGAIYDVAGFGKNFASRLQAGESFRDAYGNAAYDASHSSQPAVFATGAGATADDCYNRLLNTTMSTVTSLPRLRDGAFTHLCWTTWN